MRELSGSLLDVGVAVGRGGMVTGVPALVSSNGDAEMLTFGTAVAFSLPHVMGIGRVLLHGCH